MKPMKRMAFVMALVFVPMLTQAADYKISMERKKDNATQMKGGQAHLSEHAKEGTQNWIGEINLENLTFKPSPSLELRYVIFVKRQNLQQKAGMDQMEEVKGTIPVGILQGREKGAFPTSEVTLRQQVLDPGYYYKNGGIKKAEDSVVGVWVKVFDGQTEVAEYAAPSSVKTKYKWE